MDCAVGSRTWNGEWRASDLTLRALHQSKLSRCIKDSTKQLKAKSSHSDNIQERTAQLANICIYTTALQKLSQL